MPILTKEVSESTVGYS